MYRLPSASHTCAPCPRTRNGGVPPTDRKARTGELTPPGMSRSARVCKARDLSRLRAIVRYSPFALRSSLTGVQRKTEEFIRVGAEPVVRKITGIVTLGVNPSTENNLRAQYISYEEDHVQCGR